MKLPKLAVKRPITTLMAMFLIVIMGLVSFTNLKLELMPNINPPIIAVVTQYPDAGPEEVTEMVTKPIENVISTSSGLEGLESRSSQGTSMIIAQFDWDKDISEVRQEISTSLERMQFPDGVNKPMIVKFDPSMFPIMSFTITNEENQKELQEFLNENVIPKIQNIEGIANISITGGYEEEIEINLDKEKMKELGLNQQKIVQFIQGNDVVYPAGIIEENETKMNLRVVSKIKTIEELENLPVHINKTEGETTIVLLKEISEIKKINKDRTNIARTDSKESLLISIQKEGDANTASVNKEVREKLKEIKEKNDKFNYYIAIDQGNMVEKSVSNVSSALVYGALFAVIVILMFLRSIRATIIVGIAIPFSVVSTFVMMYFAGMTLNIMSLGGMALGVGMLVDNSIVVIENIYRHLKKEKDSKMAAIKGTKEVATAVTSSMLTTLSVFLPIVFVSGMIGDLFEELALTVSFSLLSSWLVAITVVPMLASILLKSIEEKKTKENRFYKAIIQWTLSHRLMVIFLAVLLLAFTIVSAKNVGTEYMPSQDEGTFSVTLKLKDGTKLEKTLSYVKKIENEALKLDNIDIVTSTIGSGNVLESAGRNLNENRAEITVKLKDNQNTKEAMEKLEEKISFGKGIETTYKMSNSLEMGGSSDTLEMVVLGSKEEKVQEYANELKKRLEEELDYLKNVQTSVEKAKKEYRFDIDKEEAFKYGLNSYQVALYINENIQGKIATRISNNGKETFVRVITNEIDKTKEGIEKIKIQTPIGIEIELKEIGKVIEAEGPITIIRKDQKNSVVITANISDKDLGTAISDAQKLTDEMIEDLNIDTDYTTIEPSGGGEMMEESFGNLKLALVLAIIFVYMVMASQFESFVQPLIIMLTLPLAITGVVFGLLLTNYAFGITAFIGIIILVGIVVNNAIVFLDYTNQLRKKGFEVNEALEKAGTTRLRPIVMTALTTMLGLLPLAIGTGEGAEIQAPMGIAVIGGLFTSTILTLIIIPSIYSLIETIKKIPSRWKKIIENIKKLEEK